MNQTAIVYFSKHHENTKRLVSAAGEADIFSVDQVTEAELAPYKLIGFASGIYMGKPHAGLLDLAASVAQQRQEHLPQVFAVCTSGSGSQGYIRSFRARLEELGLPVAGAFSCKGYDTFGPWKLVGGIAKHHPDQRDMDGFRDFLQQLAKP